MERETFDAIAYFQEMATKNKKASEGGFLPVIISGPQNLEGLFEQYRDYDRFIAITDNNSSNISSSDGAYGFTDRRTFTVFILAAYEYNNMDDREEKLKLCRKIFKEFVSKIIFDKFTYQEKMMYFNTQSIPNEDIGRYLVNGLTGLFFTLSVWEPVELIYDADEWNT